MGLLRLLLLLCLFAAAPGHAQTFPQLSGRVVDNANLLDPAQEADLTNRLQALEQASSRQLVVATLPDLQGYPIEDYGYRLGRAWGLGQEKANNGAILLVAPNERKVRIEVGYGLEPILTDALSGLIVRNQILPRFKAGDMAGGIVAGTDAIIQQLQAPPEQAERNVLEAKQASQAGQVRRASGGGGGSIFPLLFWGFILFFVILPMFRRRGRGRRYRRGGGFPIVLWGPGMGGGWGSGGGGFGGGGGGGFGGFSGGGGSFGGGGASGSW